MESTVKDGHLADNTLTYIDIYVYMKIAMSDLGSCAKRSLRATSHMRLRARDHGTSSTLICGKGGAGPSSLHTTLGYSKK